MKTTTLAIFISTMNNVEATALTISSLVHIPLKAACTIKVIATKKESAIISQLIKEISALLPRLVPTPELVVFDAPYSEAKAFNAAAAESNASYNLFLTAGSQLTKYSIAPLIEHFEQNPQVGIAAPVLVCPESGKVQSCGTTFTPSLRTQPFLASFPATHPAVLKKRSMQAVPLNGLILRSSDFLKIGKLDNNYKTGMEILDLCCAVRNLKKTIDIVPNATLLSPDTILQITNDDLSIDTLRLNKRCEGCFGPDKHKLAAECGYQIAISPWLESYLTLSPAKEQELNERMMQSPDPATVYAILQEEPLWQTGYVQLAAYLEATNRLAEACGIRLLQAFFFPMIPLYRKLAAVADTAGNEQLKDMTTKKLEHLDSQLEEIGPLTKKAAGLANWAKKAGEKELRALYEGWLKDLGLL